MTWSPVSAMVRTNVDVFSVCRSMLIHRHVFMRCAVCINKCINYLLRCRPLNVLWPRASFGVLSHHIENRVDAEKSHVKTMLVPFLDSRHKEHLPEETTNAAKYIVMLIRFAKRLKRGTIPVRATRFGVFLFKTTLALTRPTNFLANEGGVCANRSSAVLAGSRSCSLLPIPTTRTRFEKERDSKKFPTSDKTWLRPKRRLLAKFPGVSYGRRLLRRTVI